MSFDVSEQEARHMKLMRSISSLKSKYDPSEQDDWSPQEEKKEEEEHWLDSLVADLILLRPDLLTFLMSRTPGGYESVRREVRELRLGVGRAFSTVRSYILALEPQTDLREPLL